MHLGIAKKYPHLVQHLHKLESIKYGPIQIWGIEGASVETTHLISYWIPFETQSGTYHTLMTGVTDTLPLNTLFGFWIAIHHLNGIQS
jgi:hypothetical protein